MSNMTQIRDTPTWSDIDDFVHFSPNPGGYTRGLSTDELLATMPYRVDLDELIADARQGDNICPEHLNLIASALGELFHGPQTHRSLLARARQMIA